MRSVITKQKLLALFGLIAFLAVCCGQAAFAEYVMQQNEYMYIKMGVRGTCPDPIPISGRWSMGTVLGDPDPNNTQDDNRPLIMECGLDGQPSGRLAYSTIRVDQADIIFGDTDKGQWDIAPYRADWPYDGLIGSYIVGYWRVKDANVTVKKKMQLIRDQVRFEYTIKNEDAEAQHAVGVRLVGDVLVDDADRVAFPYLPGRGLSLSDIDLRGTGIPDYFEVFEDRYNPKVIVRNMLRGQDATFPDRLAIGEWGNIVANDWQFSPIPDRAVEDHAWAIWWDEMVLQPGQSRTIVTYCGMGTASASWTSGSPARLDPYVVAVSSPRTISTDASGAVRNFNINAYVYNLYHDVDVENVNLHLSLPTGLELVSGNPVQSVPGKIVRETESLPITWTVRATGTVAGSVTYMVSVSGSPGLQKTVSRSVVIPATFHKAITSDWQMISVPFELKDARPAYALLPYDPTIGQVVTSDLQALRWDAAANDYLPVDAISPGDGFWLKFDDSTIRQLTLKNPASTSSNATPLPSNQSRPLELKNGWNQFGNPYLYPILWGRVQVLASTQVGPVSIEEAANRGWIRRTIYWYDTGKGEYTYSSSPLTTLLPWQGYWIKALTSCQLIIPPVEQIGATASSLDTLSRLAGATSAPALPELDGWRLELKARMGDGVTGTGGIGVDSRASDGYGAEDVERPPSLSNYVTITFPHHDWGVNSGGFVQDVRRSSGDKVWEMDVSTDRVSADIVLTWPGISTVPKNYRLRLEDTETGVRKDMRTTSSYRYNAGGAPTRRFRVTAESAGLGRLVIIGLNVSASRATGGATVSYSLSTDAVTDVKIRSMSGSTVATLASGRGVTRGISSLVWNYRNQRGEAVPTGSYIIEVVATTPEGEVAKAVTPFLVAR